MNYLDIKKAINDRLKSQFSIEIQSKDVREGFNRPSFFVEFDDMTRTKYESHEQKSLTVRIYFFPTSSTHYSIELMEVQERLEDVFGLKLKVKDRLININSTESLIVDGILEFSFQLDFYYQNTYLSDSYLVNQKQEVMMDKNGQPIPLEKMDNLELKGLN